MKKEDIAILICPYCHGDLDINVFEEKNGEIIEGILKCKKCGKRYEIKDGIPVML